jgi:hypothetical protein
MPLVGYPDPRKQALRRTIASAPFRPLAMLTRAELAAIAANWAAAKGRPAPKRR